MAILHRKLSTANLVCGVGKVRQPKTKVNKNRSNIHWRQNKLLKVVYYIIVLIVNLHSLSQNSFISKAFNDAYFNR